MSEKDIEKGYAGVDNARLYYEVAGEGQPFVMIHAGVADSRQWNNEFDHFAGHYRVLRYDLRGYGRSEPVDGEYSHLGDLSALLDHLRIEDPLILMGCSMGGGIALNFALEHPDRVKALIMVDSGPPGLELDVPASDKFEEAAKAWKAGDIDLTCEIETQIWFDGAGRAPDEVNREARALAYEMNRLALGHESKKLGSRLPDSDAPAAERLGELSMPVLVVVGQHDEPYMFAAADYMLERVPTARKVIIDDAAHLPNMDQPETFRRILTAFLEEL